VIYLDNNATPRPSPGAAAAVGLGLAEYWPNPSSVHRAGQAARQQVELARRDVAALLGAKPREVVFTSGGTESIDLAVRGVLGARRTRGAEEKPVVVSTRVEHAAVRDLLEDLEKAGAAEVRWAAVDRAGLVDVGALGPVLDGASLAVFQWANNETGVIQPVEAAGALCRAQGVHFHCDATQWVGKEPVDLSGVGAGGTIDSLTCAPHKFHGPKGVGVLWMRRGVGLRPTIHGTQEMGRRGGTENVPGILGAAAAAREAAAWLADGQARTRLGAMRDRFEAAILAGIPDAKVNSAGAPRLWNTTNIGFPRLEAEALLLLLSERGVCASAGAACSSGSLDPSPVLLAMGVEPEVAHGSLRFSLSKETTEAELDEAARIVIESVRSLRGSLAATG
jgi:cysteine desulfurase